MKREALHIISAVGAGEGAALHNGVVPAKAGTHNHRYQLFKKADAMMQKQLAPRSMGPGFRRDDTSFLRRHFLAGGAILESLAASPAAAGAPAPGAGALAAWSMRSILADSRSLPT